ncbi:XkdW family protein [Bacillus nakamurai]|uniref:Phage portal protein n=1 Tax=Bacillus nakamurai TaxID=1793963 RepID=A0A150F1Q6_9BACI|nr:XkdW family protein [Bacillus nakamurai]KXZ12674.1 phage portal protein [Bacillus nakamurai]MED1228163.1 XkdW family protein [Bacillus nakamurai]
MNIGKAVLYKYPKADPTKDFIVQNEGDGSASYIAQWNIRAPIPTKEQLQAWWEESQKNPPYEPPDQVELLAQELSREKIARKQLEELNSMLAQELSDVKLTLLSLKGDNAS